MRASKRARKGVLGLALSGGEVDFHGKTFGANFRATLHQGHSLAGTGEDELDGAGPHVGARVGLPQAVAVDGGLGCNVARSPRQVRQQGAHGNHGARPSRLLRHVEEEAIGGTDCLLHFLNAALQAIALDLDILHLGFCARHFGLENSVVLFEGCVLCLDPREVDNNRIWFLGHAILLGTKELGHLGGDLIKIIHVGAAGLDGGWAMTVSGRTLVVPEAGHHGEHL